MASTPRKVPVIDISQFFSADVVEKKTIARQIGEACERIGFLVITGHQVPAEVVGRLDSAARQYFDLPTKEKMRALPPAAHAMHGYQPLAGESLGALSGDTGQQALADIKECFTMGPYRLPVETLPADQAGNHHPNFWDGVPPELREASERYFNAMETLAGDLLALLAMALDLPDRYFDAYLDETWPMANLRLINYPPLPPEVEDGRIRAGAHTDYTAITICSIDDAPGGLQVMTPSGDWEDVPYTPGAFVVNLGDTMARWTNDRWVSTIHRVANPPTDLSRETRRQSIIFFYGTRPTAVIECLPNCSGPDNPPKYEPITAIDYLMSRFSTQIGNQK
jgi:isopenicillin N synthase-like dioxygenase